MERKYVLRIYKLLLAILLINPLFTKFIANTTVLRSAELLCLLTILYYEIKLYRKELYRKFHGYEKLLYALLFAVTLSIIVRGDWPPPTSKSFYLHAVSRLPQYLLPFLLIPLNNEKYKKDILLLFYKASLFVIPLWMLDVGNLVQVGTYKAEGIGVLLPFFSAFLLGCVQYLNKRQRLITLALWAIFFLLMMLNARRNVSFSLAMYAIIGYLFYSWDSLKKNSGRFFMMSLFAILLSLILILKFDNLASGTFKNMASRAKQDTRSGVEELFFADFATSPITDWIFGRGMDGGYYQITKDEKTGEISDNRPVIETGYLNMVLKGGIIYDVVVILMMLLAIKRGFAKKDKISSFVSVILLTYFIDLYTTNPVCIFSVRSIIFWFCVSITLSKKYPVLTTR